MVAVVTGTGLGVERGSGYVLGSKGQLGDAAFGRYGENVTVNAATGNLNVTRTDEILIGQGLTTDIVRNYNSLGSGTDDNQDNWAIGNARQITNLTGTLDTAGSTVTRIDWDGSDTVYTYNTALGLYVGKQGTGAYDTLSLAGTKWTWTDGTSGAIEVYKLASNPNNPSDTYWARLISTTDEDGDTESYTWSGNLLTQVTSSSGETVTLNYTGNDLMSLTTTLSDGTYLNRTYYTYDASDRLSTVTTDLSPNDNSVADGNIVVTTYTYDHASDRVASIAQTGGALLTIAYDSANRVASFTQTDAAGITSKTTLTYDTVNNATTVTDALGNATKLTYDPTTGLLTRIDYPPATTGAAPESAVFTYDANGNLASAADGLGNVTTYGYDADGNLTLLRTATGDTTAWTYSATNKVVTETQYFGADPDGSGAGKPTQPATMRYAYDANDNLRYVVSALGEVTEYRWAGSQQTSSLVYRGQTYDVSGLGVTDTISEAQLNTWVAGIADKSGAIRTDTRYDVRGLVNRVQTYGNTLADGTGDATSPFTRVSYVYDQYGNLLSRHTTGLGTQTFVYDGLGRLISSVDLDGGTTTYAFNDGANTTTLTLASGAQTVSTYNLAGQLIQTQTTAADIPAASVAFAYDKDGNLRMVTDADGNRTYIVYDALNRKIADIAADGAIVEYRYDAADRLIATVQYVNKVTAFTSLVDANGNPKTVVLSTILPSATANDRYRWNVYDAMGRVVETIDSEGDAEAYAYDGRSDVVGMTAYANVVDPATVTGFKAVPPTASVLPTADAKRDDAVRSFYDSDGRLVGTIDATNHVTQIVYDEAGEKIATTVYADTGIWHSTFAQVLATVTPTAQDITTRYVYDDRGLLTYTLDGTLAPTEYDYDNEGRLVATYQYGGAIAAAASYTASYIAGQIASLHLATNPATKSSWNVYNAANHLVETIDSDGDVTTYAYDVNGKLVASRTYANVLSAASLAGFRAAPPTSFQLPAADSTRDDYTRYFYDSLGREIGTLDAKGYLTQAIYDANGLKTDSIAYAGLTATGQRSAGTFTQLLNSIAPQPANDIHDRYFYDADNRLKYTVDSALNVTEADYDGQGNVLHAIRYGAPINTTATWSAAYVASQISALGLATNAATRTNWNVYDSDGRLAYTIDPLGYVIANSYDGKGQLIKQVAYATAHLPSVDYTQAQWDSWASGQSANVNNRVGRLFYDALGRQIYRVDALGYVDMTQYDFAGRVTLQVRYADPYTVTDAVTDMTTVLPVSIPGTAVQHSFAYDTDGRVTDSYDGLAIRTHNTYDALGHLLTRTVAYNTGDAATTTYGYDTLGRVVSETDGLGNVQSCTYDGFGNKLTETDANGNVTTNAYDQRGQAIAVTDATSAVTHYQYDAFGNVLLVTDANGNKVYKFYDNNDRLVLTVDGELYAIGFTYDAFGNAIATTQYAGKVTGTVTAGVLPTVTAGANDITTYAFYDNDGRKVLDIDGEAYATKMVYNAFDEVVTAIHYANAVQGPITPGVLPSITANGTHDEKTQFARDALGEVTLETDADSYTESFGYDAFGNQTTVTNQLGGTTVNAYDKDGRLLTATLSETSVNSAGTVMATSVVEKYTYDRRGNRVTMVGAYGLTEARTTTYGYDLDDRLLTTTGNSVYYLDPTTFLNQTAAAPVTTNVYDDNGNLIEQDDPNGDRTLFFYDAANRKIAELGANGVLSTWVYDGAGNVKSERVYGDTFALPAVPGGAPPSTASTDYRETTYTYYKNNRLKTTTVAGVMNWQVGATAPTTNNAVVTDYYDAFGNLVMQTDARGDNSWFFYDGRGDKIAQVDQELYLTAYALDLDGNVLTETRYATRLSAAPASSPPATTAPAGTSDPAHDRITNFTYDRMGRRLTEQRMGLDISTVNATTGALTTATNQSATVKYQYNGLGEVIQKTEATNDATTYVYDSMGRQTSTTTASFKDDTGATVATTTTMTYDGLGNLTSSTENGTRVTTYSYARGGRLMSMTDADGDTQSYGYDLAGNRLLTSYLRTQSNGSAVKDASLVHYNAVGEVDLEEKATWSSGTGAWTLGDQQNIQYDAWGDVVAKGVNGAYQEYFTYDNAGNLASSNSGDGTVKFYFYDLDGKQTAEVTTDGTGLGSGPSWSNISQAQVIALITNTGTAAVGAYDAKGVILTFNTYDKRGLQLSTIQPFRDLSTGGASVKLTTSQTYNAFGEVLTQTDARNYTTTYTYNTMGKVTSTALPAVAAYDEHGNAILDANGNNENPTSYVYYDASGRVVATKDANLHVDTRILLAGSGYDGADALTVEEFHPDGGAVATYYDVNRDKVKQSVNGLVGTGEIDETFTYDAMDRLLSDTHPTRAVGSAGNNTSVAQTLIDYYVYDELGERIAHYNSVYGQTVEETSDYDRQGRLVKSVDMDGHVTTYKYQWTATANAAGFGDFGGWIKTTVNATALTETETDGYFGQTVAKTDFGGRVYTYGFDLAGRVVREVNNFDSSSPTLTTYFNTGNVAEVVTGYRHGDYDNDDFDTYADEVTSVYSYDQDGNRVYEYYQSDKWSSTYFRNYDGDIIWRKSGPGEVILESATATYDADDRVVTITDAGDEAPMSVTYAYDLNGNIRRMTSSFHTLNAQGVVSTGTSTEDYWYKYDAMNRFTTTMGTLSGGVISHGTAGSDITYNRDGSRAAMTDASSTEVYTYSADGYLARTDITLPGYFGGSLTETATSAYDAMGRVTDYAETDTTGATIYHRYNVLYDQASLLQTDTVMSKQGSTTTTQTSNYYYMGQGDYDTVNKRYEYDGAYQGGAVTDVKTTSTTGGTTTHPETQNFYTWYDSAVQSSIEYQANTNGTIFNTSYAYDGAGHLETVTISDGRPRTVSFNTDAFGQIMTRDEASSSSGNPHEIHYYFNGIQVGDVSNNGTSDTDYAASITAHTTANQGGAFRNGSTSALPYANFDQSYDPINGNSNQSTASSYTVAAGDTLMSIAQAVWGDASLWYVIADANGLSQSDQLVAGQTLSIPNKITNVHNNTTTFKVYDPNDAVGNTMPNTPKPKSHHGCGVFGMILLAVIAVVVTVVTAGAAIAALAPASAGITGIGSALGAIAAGTTELSAGTLMAVGAGAAAAGSIVSQGVGLATGIQSSFNWGAVGMAAIGGAITAGLGPNPLTGSGAFGGFGVVGGAIARAVAGNVLTQGIGVATGLQKKFDWAGVAAAGVSAGVSAYAGENLPGAASVNAQGATVPATFANQAISGMAGMVAGAATRSLVNGSDFGDNILAALPGTVASTVGQRLATQLAGFIDSLNQPDDEPGLGDGVDDDAAAGATASTATGATSAPKSATEADKWTTAHNTDIGKVTDDIIDNAEDSDDQNQATMASDALDQYKDQLPQSVLDTMRRIVGGRLMADGVLTGSYSTSGLSDGELANITAFKAFLAAPPDMIASTDLTNMTSAEKYYFAEGLVLSKSYDDPNVMARLDAMEQGESGEPILVGMRQFTNELANNGRGVFDDVMFIMSRDSDGVESGKTFTFNGDPSGRYDVRSQKNKNGDLVYVSRMNDEQAKEWSQVQFHKAEGWDMNSDGVRDAASMVADSYYFEPKPGGFIPTSIYNGAKAPAWESDEAVPVDRITGFDGVPSYSADDYDPIHAGATTYVHIGGAIDGVTGSAGCQTIPRDDYVDFVSAVGGRDTSFYYVLVNAKNGG